MDKIWDRKIFRSRRSLVVVAGMKIPNDHEETTKSRTLKKGARHTFESNENTYFKS